MLALIVSDNLSTAARLQSIVVDYGVDCPSSHVVSVGGALEIVGHQSQVGPAEQKPDVIFVVVSPDVDRGLAVLEQLKRTTCGKLVAVGAADDPHLILRVVHAGPDDYLDESGDLEAEVETLLERLRTTYRAGESMGRLITLMSPSGGCGCSMIASNLAVALAENHGQCGLCDLDLRRGDLASMLNLKPRHTIIDLCSNVQKLDQQMFEQSLLQHESGVRLLAAPQSFDDVQQVTSDAVEKVMQFARMTFPCVVVDLEDFFHREQFRVLQLSDEIFFILRLDFSALRNARRTLDYLQSVGVDRDKFQLVVNQFGRPKELQPEQAEEALSMKIAHFVPDDPKSVVLSFNRGVPVISESPRSKLAQAIRKLAASAFDPVAV